MVRPPPFLSALALAPLLALAACASSGQLQPSLAPRAAEAIDPRLPLSGEVAIQPASAALTGRLAAIAAQARAGEGLFNLAMGDAERLVSSAGGPQSESWIVAQTALSAAVAARGVATRALGDIDAIAASALARQSGIAPGDLAAIESAAEQVGAIDRGQAKRINAVQARLGG